MVNPLRTNDGLVSVLVLLAIPLLVAVVLTTVRAYRMFERRAYLQSVADAAAGHAAAVQARFLNATALTNGLIVATNSLAGAAFLGGHGTAAVLDGLLVTLPEGVEVHQLTNEVFEELQEFGRTVSDFQDILLPAHEWLPLAATQAPLLYEKGLAGRIFLLPYPLPGMSSELSLRPPFAGRQISGNNLAKNIERKSQKVFEKLTGSVEGRLRLGLRGCRALTGSVETVFGVFRQKKDSSLSGSVEKLCKRELSRYKSAGSYQSYARRIMQRGEDAATASASSTGFALPLSLTQSYQDFYRIGVVAFECGSDCSSPTMNTALESYAAIAEAGAVSVAQPRGGDLFIPDFSSRLSPVSLLNAVGDDAGTSKLRSALWVLH